MVRTGAVDINVGINRLSDGRLVGEVDFEGVRNSVSKSFVSRRKAAGSADARRGEATTTRMI
jgi:hypothetical protein